MQVRFVGSGDAFGSGGRAQTCIALTAPAATVLVDCGATSLSAMKAQGLDPGAVDAVVVSHLHGDHFGGIPFLVLDGQFSRRTAALTVVGPPGTDERLHTAMEALYPGSTRVERRFALDVVELRPDGTPHVAEGWSVRGWEVDHASGAPPLGLSVALGGRTFAYSGDTAWVPALREVAGGAHLFAAEAYSWERRVRFHLAYADLVEHADELEARRTIVTHMSPDMLARLDECSHEAATDGLVLDV